MAAATLLLSKAQQRRMHLIWWGADAETGKFSKPAGAGTTRVVVLNVDGKKH
jgi:hypothetical protein